MIFFQYSGKGCQSCSLQNLSDLFYDKCQILIYQIYFFTNIIFFDKTQKSASSDLRILLNNKFNMKKYFFSAVLKLIYNCNDKSKQ
jgi:hypothetical protein